MDRSEMNIHDLIGKRVERILYRKLPNTITLYKQEGIVLQEVKASKGRKAWVLFDGNTSQKSIEITQLRVID